MLDELVCSALHQADLFFGGGGGGDLQVTDDCWGLIMRSMALVGRAANKGNQIFLEVMDATVAGSKVREESGA